MLLSAEIVVSTHCQTGMEVMLLQGDLSGCHGYFRRARTWFTGKVCYRCLQGSGIITSDVRFARTLVALMRQPRH